MRVDRAWRVSYSHKNQLVQHANLQCELASGEPAYDPGNWTGGPSIWYTALHFTHIGYQDLPSQAEISLVWTSCLEMRPDWVNKAYGGNEERVCMVKAGILGPCCLRSQQMSQKGQP